MSCGPTPRFWTHWFWWATHSRLAPVRAMAWLIKRHWAHVVTYFQHRITNAVSEGLNSKIQTIKKMAYGFRNRTTSKPPSSSTVEVSIFTHANVGRTFFFTQEDKRRVGR
ncbi:MAG: transposase [Nitrospiraceae bacterium]